MLKIIKANDMRNSRYFVLFLILLPAHFVLSQSKKIIPSPSGNMRQWEVVINKAGVSAYGDRALTNRIAGVNLPFKQQYYVVDYRMENGAVVAVQITLSKYSKTYYWINANDLLLTNFCLKHRSISVKATVVNYIKNRNPKSDYFDGPNQQNQLGEAKWYHIYFVYATHPANVDPDEAEFLLLGTDHRFDPAIEEYNAKKTVLGWFQNGSSQNLVVWNTRIGFQPNLSNSARREKGSSGIYASILSTIPDAMRWATGGSYAASKVLSDDSIQVNSNYQFQLTDFRMPITKVRKVNEKTVYEVAYAGNAIFNQESLRREREEIESFKTINVLYVVDVTATMCRYLTDLPRAIEAASRFVEKQYPSYQFRWGLATFRNESDAESDQYQFIGEAENYKDFAKLVARANNCWSNSNSLPEILFEGTRRAVSDFFDASTKGIKVTFAFSDVSSSYDSRNNAVGLGSTLGSLGSHFFALNVGYHQEALFREQINQVVQMMNGHEQAFSVLSDREGALKYYFVPPDDANESDYQGVYVKVNQAEYYQDILLNMLLSIVEGNDNNYRETLYGLTGSEPRTTRKNRPVLNKALDITFPMSFKEDYKNIHLRNDEVGIYYSKGFVVNEHDRLRTSQPFEPVALLSTEDCYRLQRVTEHLIEILGSTNPGSEITAPLAETLKELTGETQLYADIDYLKGITTQIPVGSQLIEDFRRYGANFLQHKSSAGIERLRAKLIEKRKKIIKYYDQLYLKKGIKLGSAYYQWIKLSDLP